MPIQFSGRSFLYPNWNIFVAACGEGLKEAEFPIREAQGLVTFVAINLKCVFVPIVLLIFHFESYIFKNFNISLDFPI